jgi:hypothetical protein
LEKEKIARSVLSRMPAGFARDRIAQIFALSRHVYGAKAMS